ncbi:CAP domain-containing protein, partial [Polyangium sp. 6x1]|uniref:CAP domain-containing protein n=1 Tax=Polyangium sp. 6x1 TaxID=3042689 RepID=UPI002482412D
GAGSGGAGGSSAGSGGAGQGAGGGGASSTASSGGGASCGDEVCSGGESCETCPMDCGACEACMGAGAATTSLDAEEQGFLGILNDYRAQNGLPPLMGCTSLHRAAQGHSEDMRDQNYFSHTGLNGSGFSDRACDACYDHACPVQTAMGENIAAGNGTADATFTQWKNSAGHNANMLGSSYTVIGIGRATGGGDYGAYWTTVFGGATEASCN